MEDKKKSMKDIFSQGEPKIVKYASYESSENSDIYDTLAKMQKSDDKYSHFTRMASAGSATSKLNHTGVRMVKEAQVGGLIAGILPGLISAAGAMLSGVAINVIVKMVENKLGGNAGKATKEFLGKINWKKIADEIKALGKKDEDITADDADVKSIVDKAVDEADTTGVADAGAPAEGADKNMPIAASVKIKKVKKAAAVVKVRKVKKAQNYGASHFPGQPWDEGKSYDELFSKDKEDGEGEDEINKYYEKGSKVIVTPNGSGQNAPASDWIKSPTEVEMLEEGRSGGWDVYDVRLPSGEEESIYGFNIDDELSDNNGDKPEVVASVKVRKVKKS